MVANPTLITALAVLGVAFTTTAIAAGPITLAFLLLASAVLAVASVIAIAVAGFSVFAGTVALFASLATETAGFKLAAKAFEGIISQTIEALEPMSKPLMSLVGLFGTFIQILAPIFAELLSGKEITSALFNVAKFLMITFLRLVQVGLILAGPLSFLVDIVGHLQVALGSFLKWVEEKTGFDLGGQALQNAGVETLVAAARFRNKINPALSAIEEGINAISKLTQKEAEQKAKDAAKFADASESLLNIPAGFKIAAERFKAANIEGTGLNPFAQGADAPSARVTADTIVIVADDPERFLAIIDRGILERKTNQHGNPFGGGSTGNR